MASVDLEVGGPDQLAVLGMVALHHLAELLGGSGHRFQTRFLILLFHFRRLQDGVDFPVDARGDLARRAGRHHDALPGEDLESRHCLAQHRQVGKGLPAACGVEHGDRLDAPGLDLRPWWISSNAMSTRPVVG